MKLFFNLFGMAAAGALGYFAEPSLRFSLTGVMPSAIELAKKTNVVLITPDGTPNINLAQLTPQQLPQRVLLTGGVKVTDAASGVSMTIEAGNRVSLVGVEGGNVRVSPPGAASFQGLVPISDTDLVQQVTAGHFSNAVIAPPAVMAPVEPQPAPEPEPVVEEPVIAAPTPQPEEVTAIPEPAPLPADPAPEPQMEAAVEIEPAPPAPTPPASDTTDVVSAMQASIGAGQIKEFKADQVQEWTAQPDEIIDGVNYQIGVASYKAETMFGVRVIQAKALVKDGKVQRWVYSKSGMDMK